MSTIKAGRKRAIIAVLAATAILGYLLYRHSVYMHEVTVFNDGEYALIIHDFPGADFRAPDMRVSIRVLEPGKSGWSRLVFTRAPGRLPARATLVWQLAEITHCDQPHLGAWCELTPVPGQIHRWTLDLKAMRRSPEGLRPYWFTGPLEGRDTLHTRIRIADDTVRVELGNRSIGGISWN